MPSRGTLTGGFYLYYNVLTGLARCRGCEESVGPGSAAERGEGDGAEAAAPAPRRAAAAHRRLSPN